ncbi:hypothetical protein [Richelia sinica]|nr:hypothetical protein [Richelia sinica]
MANIVNFCQNSANGWLVRMLEMSQDRRRSLGEDVERCDRSK